MMWFPLYQLNTLALVAQDYSWQKKLIFGFFYCQYLYFIQLLNNYFWFFPYFLKQKSTKSWSKQKILDEKCDKCKSNSNKIMYRQIHQFSIFT